MKVILLRDVARIGKKGVVVNVPDGYALNQLIPSRSAEPATPQNLKKLSRLQETKTAEKAASDAQFTAEAAALTANTLSISLEANEKGHLFKAIAANDIVQAAAAVGIAVKPSDVAFVEPVKELGEHTVLLRRGDQQASFTISVVKK